MPILMRLGIGRRAEAHVALLDVLLPHHEPWCHGRRIGIVPGTPGRQIGERSLDQRLELCVLEVSRGGNDQVRRQVGAREVPPEAGGLERCDRVGGSQNRPAERMTRPELLSEHFVDEIVRRILDHLDLFENDALLLIDVRRREGRAHHQIVSRSIASGRWSSRTLM